MTKCKLCNEEIVAEVDLEYFQKIKMCPQCFDEDVRGNPSNWW